MTATSSSSRPIGWMRLPRCCRRPATKSGGDRDVGQRVAYCRAAAVVGDVDPDVPGYDWRTPTVIVPHTAPDDVPADGVYTFVRSPREAAEVAIGLAGGM